MSLSESKRGRTSPRRSGAWIAAAIAALAAFQGAALAYYHLVREGGEFDRNPVTATVVAAYEGLGFLPALLFSALVLIWGTSTFVNGRLRAPTPKVVGVVASVLLLAAFLRVAEGAGEGGTIGARLGEVTTSLLGKWGAIVALGGFLLVALSLATERFFSPAARRAAIRDADDADARREAKRAARPWAKPTVPWTPKRPVDTATKPLFEGAAPPAVAPARPVPLTRPASKLEANAVVPVDPSVEWVTPAKPAAGGKAKIGPQLAAVPRLITVPQASDTDSTVRPETAEIEVHDARDERPDATGVGGGDEQSSGGGHGAVAGAPDATQGSLAGGDGDADRRAVAGGSPPVDLARRRVPPLLDAPAEGAPEAPPGVIAERAPAGETAGEPTPVEPESLGDPEREGENSAAAAPDRSASSDEELEDDAAQAIFDAGRASVSVLQARLGVPFMRASRLLKRLEKAGLVGPYRGGSARDILLAREDWERRTRSERSRLGATP